MCEIIACDTCEQEVLIVCGYSEDLLNKIRVDNLVECLQCANHRARIAAKRIPSKTNYGDKGFYG